MPTNDPSLHHKLSNKKDHLGEPRGTSNLFTGSSTQAKTGQTQFGTGTTFGTAGGFGKPATGFGTGTGFQTTGGFGGLGQQPEQTIQVVDETHHAIEQAMKSLHPETVPWTPRNDQNEVNQNQDLIDMRRGGSRLSQQEIVNVTGSLELQKKTIMNAFFSLRLDWRLLLILKESNHDIDFSPSSQTHKLTKAISTRNNDPDNEQMKRWISSALGDKKDVEHLLRLGDSGIGSTLMINAMTPRRSKNHQLLSQHRRDRHNKPLEQHQTLLVHGFD
ncbi:hypothetical protein BLNAU_24683 [Blattamonas nauphoetae]|uniref:Uncharacterized protein n=1 Tax=Blattamonas nauphoetae TaxID=2049346 RepID=A0ABQ9WLR6_9EUKA|nr:hypothetical protein BLNAU_24683 [Blattamonas nauphoetae]